MEKAIEFIKQNINLSPFVKNITVYGWQNNYEHTLIQSVSNYLFEDLDIIDNITPLTNENRPGNIKPKYYVCVHDTGDASTYHNAKFWSNTVRDEMWEQGKYACSYQYVVGNDGIYQQIPDNEVAWHAGDTTKYDYALYDAKVKGSNEHPIITISSDGYYEIDGKKSAILAPRAYKEKDGVVILDRIAQTSDINNQGILCKLIDGNYYIGETYFNTTYLKVANRGGNNNSIGIESCVCENNDIYLNWQRTAKLVAKLLVDNNLSFDDVKQHHYFSGKNCPQTIRENNMWQHFMSLVKCEYQGRLLLLEGYKFELVSTSNSVLANGRVISIDEREITIKIIIRKDNEAYTLEYIIKVKQ